MSSKRPFFSAFFEKIGDSRRDVAIDYCRALAIVAVVLFHFDSLPFGYLGVDLFFVISGFLVSRPLIEGFRKRESTSVLNFIARRAFKIWPSYFLFLILGNMLAMAMYRDSHASQVITAEHIPRYLFFFLNYRGLDHWSFDHLWSICVEEHFYFVLPVAFMFFSAIARKLGQLAVLLVVAIFLGNMMRIAGYFVGFETYSATHNRIDALAWGVLLALLKAAGWRDSIKGKAALGMLATGLLVLVLATYIHATAGDFFRKAIFHGIVPAGAFLCVAALQGISLPKLTTVQLLAYGSYNWYLWHPLFVLIVKDVLGTGPVALACYLLFTFAVGLIATRLIEEPILALRDELLRKKNTESGDAQGESRPEAA